MNPVPRIPAISDGEVDGLVSPATMTSLASDITGTPVPAPAGRGWLVTRRGLLIGIPVAAALATAGLVVSSLGSPGQHLGPVPIGPAKAQAAVMSVTRYGGYLDVIVTNPVADAAKYRAVFARYGLNISLTLVPASPSLVGTLVYSGGSDMSALEPITAVGRCYTGGGGNVCPVGVKVPLNFAGQAVLTFGRAARPGELYETTAPADAPGEAMYGLSYVGKTVTQVLAMLAGRHVTAAHYLISRHCENVGAAKAPGGWYVTGADPWAPGQVQLWVSATWPPATCTGAPRPAPAPASSPSSG
jgi:hypothetical protein